MEIKWKKWIGWLLGIALAILLRKTLGRIALLFLVSATLAYLLYPLARFFHQKMRMNMNLSTAMAFVSVVLVLTAFGVFGMPALYRQIELLGQNTPKLVESLGNFVLLITDKLVEYGLPPEMVSSLKGQEGNLFALFAKFLAGKLLAIINGMSNLGYLIFSPVLAFYMLRDKRRLFSFLTRLIPSKYRKSVLRVSLSVRDAIASYVHGQLAVSAITGAITGVGLLFIGLPSWFAMGVVMMVCNLIPYFGPWLGAIPIVIFSISYGLPMVVGGMVVLLVAQQIEGMVVAPFIIGDVASLHPAQVVLALVVGGWIAGLPGMFYSIPAVVSLRAMLQSIRDAKLRL